MYQQKLLTMCCIDMDTAIFNQERKAWSPPKTSEKAEICKRSKEV